MTDVNLEAPQIPSLGSKQGGTSGIDMLAAVIFAIIHGGIAHVMNSFRNGLTNRKFTDGFVVFSFCR